MKKTKRLAKKVGEAGATRKSKTRLFFLNLGKVFIDMAKLCFASLVLGIIIRGEIPQETLLMIGIIATAAGALFGIIMVTIFEEK
jgi:hypothetical protein